MKYLKKTLFPIFSVLLSFQTYELVKILVTSPQEFSFLLNIAIAFLLTLYITGVFAFIGFAYPSNRVLPSAYYRIKNPKFLNTTYKLIGVRFFRFILMLTFWGKEKNRKKYFNGTKKGLQNFIYQTKQSEFGHLAALVVIQIISFYLLFYGYSLMVLFITVINLIGNFYPIVLQRHHRIRIEKITG